MWWDQHKEREREREEFDYGESKDVAAHNFIFDYTSYTSALIYWMSPCTGAAKVGPVRGGIAPPWLTRIKKTH